MNQLLPVESATKERIIEILSEQWPYTAKKMYHTLTKKHTLSVTYQAVHKSLRELSERGVLEKGEEGYQLSEKWLTDLGEFSKKTKNRYEHLGQAREVKVIHKMVFHKNIDFVRFHIGFLESLAQRVEKLSVTFHFRHVPYPFKMSVEEIQKIVSLFPRVKWTILSRNSTPLDQLFAKYWRNLGVEVEVGVETASDSMIINNDYIVQLIYPKEAMKGWDEMFAINPPEQFDVKKLTDSITEPSYKFTVLIIKDKDIADLLNKRSAKE